MEHKLSFGETKWSEGDLTRVGRHISSLANCSSACCVCQCLVHTKSRIGAAEQEMPKSENGGNDVGLEQMFEGHTGRPSQPSNTTVSTATTTVSLAVVRSLTHCASLQPKSVEGRAFGNKSISVNVNPVLGILRQEVNLHINRIQLLSQQPTASLAGTHSLIIVVSRHQYSSVCHYMLHSFSSLTQNSTFLCWNSGIDNAHSKAHNQTHVRTRTHTGSKSLSVILAVHEYCSPKSPLVQNVGVQVSPCCQSSL